MIAKDFGVTQIEPFVAELLEESVWVADAAESGDGLLPKSFFVCFELPENRAP